MGALGSSLTPDVLRSFASASLTSNYQLVGSIFTYPVRIMKITSTSSTAVTISWDGVNDHEFLPAGAFLLLDVSANREASQICEIPKGTSIMVKGTAGTGNIYVSTYVVKSPMSQSGIADASSSGAGTVTSFSFTDANGFDGTVTNPTTTPNLTLTTTVANKQVIFSNGGALSGESQFSYDSTNHSLDVGSVTQNLTNVTTSPYVVLDTDRYLSVNSSVIPIIIQMPNVAVDSREIIVKDSKGSSATNNITVTTVGGVVDIDAAPTYVLNTNYASAQFIFNASAYEVF